MKVTKSTRKMWSQPIPMKRQMELTEDIPTIFEYNQDISTVIMLKHNNINQVYTNIVM